MGKAYEIATCGQCPHYDCTPGSGKHPKRHFCNVLLEELNGTEITNHCPLPDMPISKMETTTSVKGGD
jgi:hypothetical protein